MQLWFFFARVLCVLSLLLLPSCIKKEKSEESKKTSESLNTAVDSASLTGEFDPLASAQAKVGGTYTTWGAQFPKSLNYFLDNNSLSKEIMDLMFEPLMGLKSNKNEPLGVLAESCEVLVPDQHFRFHIRPQAKWSDGMSITSKDFQFYYDVMMNPKNLTSVFRVGLSRFKRPVIIDSLTFEFEATQKHWSNFYEAGGLVAFPEHVWKGVDFNTINDSFPVVSGPYKIHKLNTGRSIVMERRSDWWGRSLAYNAYKYNFEKIEYVFMEDRNKALEAFQKGEFDVYPVYTASIWAMKTRFPAVERGWVARQEIYNQEPKGFQGMALNMRRPQLADIKVRQALALLLNRQQMNEKLMYNQYFLLNSYYPDLYPNLQNPSVPMTPFNPDSARSLLKAAGYTPGADGWLVKNGKVLTISILSSSSDQRHMNIYMEDLKSVGIKVGLEELSMASLRKRLDNHDFDMYWIAWGASRLRDPEGQWLSKYANELASNNMSGLKDKVVDSLIKIQMTVSDLAKRDSILKAIDVRLTELVPYVLLWQSGFHRVLYWNKFGTPKNVFDKYNREESILAYWWVDSAKNAALENAKSHGESLPKPPSVIKYAE